MKFKYAEVLMQRASNMTLESKHSEPLLKIH
jgi:hypothetical protein